MCSAKGLTNAGGPHAEDVIKAMLVAAQSSTDTPKRSDGWIGAE